jgi:formate dehydrogenase alpha subunit
MPRVLTTCVYCGTGCNLYLKVTNGRVTGVLPSRSGPGEGKLCIKGWSAYEFIHSPQRLTQPLIKDGESFREVNWDEALRLVSEKLLSVKEKYGPNSLAVLSSAKCTNEENYVLQKFARAVLGTNNIDHSARLCHASTVAGLGVTFGAGAMTNSLEDIEDADVIFVIGSNTTEQHPLIGRRILRAIREKGTKLIVADPRSINLTEFAEVYLQHKPGTDVALINGMMNVILSEGLHDSEFIRQRTRNFEGIKSITEKYSPEYTERITGVPAEEIIKAAQLYGKAKRASIIYCMGITQHTTGTDNVMSLANLAMMTGNVGKRGTGVNPLRGQNNVQGACDAGALPDVFSGYQKVTDYQSREKMQRAWNIAELDDKPGLTQPEMIDSAYNGNLKALYIIGENPALSHPDINHVRESLKKLEFLIVQDMFLTETAKLAHIVLPAASFAEKDGTFTSTERRVQRIRRAIEPIKNCREDWRITSEIAERMGYKGLTYSSAKQIMDEISSVTPAYGGISWDRLENGGLQWPCWNDNHPGTQILHEKDFSGGPGKFVPVDFQPAAEEPDKDYPMRLITGRLLFLFHTNTMTGQSPTLKIQAPEGYIEMNPDDARMLGVSEGERVKIKSRRGEISTKVFLTPIVPQATVFIPFHFMDSPANALTNSALDPKSKIAEVKLCAARVERIE